MTDETPVPAHRIAMAPLRAAVTTILTPPPAEQEAKPADDQPGPSSAAAQADKE